MEQYRPTEEQIAEAKRQMALEEEIAARAKIAKARTLAGQNFTSGEIPTMGKSVSSEIPVGKRDPTLMAGPRPYNGGKKRRHRKKSRKHSRRH